MSRTLTNNFRDEKNKLQSSSVIRLFKLYTTTPLYFAEYTENVVFDGITYVAFPILSTDISENITGTIDSLTITVGNANRNVIALIQGEDFLDLQVDVIEVFANNLSDPNAYIKDIYYITNISVTQEVATFTLDNLLMRIGIQIPKMTYAKGSCQWKYKSNECGYESQYANVTFHATVPRDSNSSISWNATTINGVSINAGSVAYVPYKPIYIYYIEGNSTLGTCTELPNELLSNTSPKWIILCKYFGGTKYKRYWSNTVDISNYPQAVTTSCDFTYKGINGCFAHNNNMRFGAFPGVGHIGQYGL